jgi:hypothetical protein
MSNQLKTNEIKNKIIKLIILIKKPNDIIDLKEIYYEIYFEFYLDFFTFLKMVCDCGCVQIEEFKYFYQSRSI